MRFKISRLSIAEINLATGNRAWGGVMWSWFRRVVLRRRTVAEEATDVMRDLQAQWTVFIGAVPMRADVPLADRIFAFAWPATRWVARRHPRVYDAGGLPRVLVLIGMAVEAAGPWPGDEVKRAMPAVADKVAALLREAGASPQPRP